MVTNSSLPDYYSAPLRKARRNLLIVSTIATLFCTLDIDLSKASFLGMSIPADRTEWLPVVLLAFLIYSFCMFRVCHMHYQVHDDYAMSEFSHNSIDERIRSVEKISKLRTEQVDLAITEEEAKDYRRAINQTFDLARKFDERLQGRLKNFLTAYKWAETRFPEYFAYLAAILLCRDIGYWIYRLTLD